MRFAFWVQFECKQESFCAVFVLPFHRCNYWSKAGRNAAHFSVRVSGFLRHLCNFRCKTGRNAAPFSVRFFGLKCPPRRLWVKKGEMLPVFVWEFFFFSFHRCKSRSKQGRNAAHFSERIFGFRGFDVQWGEMLPICLWKTGPLRHCNYFLSSRVECCICLTNGAYTIFLWDLGGSKCWPFSWRKFLVPTSPLQFGCTVGQNAGHFSKRQLAWLDLCKFVKQGEMLPVYLISLYLGRSILDFRSCGEDILPPNLASVFFRKAGRPLVLPCVFMQVGLRFLAFPEKTLHVSPRHFHLVVFFGKCCPIWFFTSLGRFQLPLVMATGKCCPFLRYLGFYRCCWPFEIWCFKRGEMLSFFCHLVKSFLGCFFPLR